MTSTIAVTWRAVVLILLLLLLPAVPGKANPPAGENVPDWDTRFALPGLPNPPHAIAVSGNDVYVGGDFSRVGSQVVAGIAHWDGTRWNSLGGGVNGGVAAIVVAGTDVYVSGGFTTAGGVPASNVARWDGTRWHALGSGINGGVVALLVVGDSLYAGGYFSSAGGVTANNVARWHNGKWSPLGNGRSRGVHALAHSSQGLYAGGEGGHLGRWDGQQWQEIGEGVLRSRGTIFSLACIGNMLYVGGQFEVELGNRLVDSLIGWDGLLWAQVGADISYDEFDIVHDMLVVDGDLYAGGTFNGYTARWDGSQWHSLGGGVWDPHKKSESYVTALGGDSSHVVVGGRFYRADGVRARNIASWDIAQGRWSSPSSGEENGLGEAVYAMAVDPADGSVYVGGRIFGLANAFPGSILKWDHGGWVAIPGEVSGLTYGPGDGTERGWVFAIAVSGSEIYIGGDFWEVGGVSARNVARWDGDNWSALDTGVNSRGVASIAISGTDVYVGGDFTQAGGHPAVDIAKWSDNEWKPVGGGILGQVNTLEATADGIYAGGEFIQAGGRPARNLAKWDGTLWTDVGGGVEGIVNDIAPGDDSDLYVAGRFQSAGGVPAGNIARWDGSAWSPLGSGVNGNVDAVAVDGHNVYALGVFTQAGGLPVSNIARWDGKEWHPLGGRDAVVGTGLTGHYIVGGALGVWDGDVFIGGYFERAGGHFSNNFAIWHGAEPSAPDLKSGGSVR